MHSLILLPGMMCDHRMFAHQTGALNKDYEVSVADFSNHHSMEAIAADILKTAPERFSLGGLSMGGIVAMEIIAQAPSRIEKLILMDTNPRAELDAVKQNREPQIAKALNGQLLEVMRDEMKPNYLADGPDKIAILDLCMEMAMELGPEKFEAQSRALQTRPDYQGVLKSFEQPSLVLCGAQDRLCPVERHELMHELLPNSQLEIIEGAGHLPTLEQSAKTTGLIADFLRN